MSNTKSIEILNIARAVNDEQEDSGRWNDIYMRNDGTYMRLCNHRNMMTVTVNVKADKINVEMYHYGDSTEESVEVSAAALNKVINTLYDDGMEVLISRSYNTMAGKPQPIRDRFLPTIL